MYPIGSVYLENSKTTTEPCRAVKATKNKKGKKKREVETECVS